MLFAIIRLLPFIIPVYYFLSLKSLFYYSSWWPIVLVSIIAINIAYLLLLRFKSKDKTASAVLFYSIIYAVLGFVYVLILENPLFINLFLFFWSLIFFIYWEAAFHYFYQTQKRHILEMKNIILYLNLIIIFVYSSLIMNLNIFLSLDWYWVLLIAFIINLVLLINFFLFNGLPLRRNKLAIFAMDLILLQLLGALIFLPISFYVVAFIISLGYYWLTSFYLLFINNNLRPMKLIKYLAFGLIISLFVILTSFWL